MENNQQLTALLIIPVLGMLITGFIPKVSQRIYAVIISLIQFLVSIYLVSQMWLNKIEVNTVSLDWLNALGIHLQLRLDQQSWWFILLSNFVSVVVLGLKGSWYKKHTRLFVVSALFLIFAMNIAFLSTNLILFYLAYEAVFIPMIIMIGIWGSGAKASAVLRFFLMSFLGSILMLVSIFYLSYLNYVQTGSYSANLEDLLKVTQSQDPHLIWCFFGFVLAFLIKVPMIPLHGWLKEAYVNAPTPATIWLTAVLSKLGVFGILQFVIPLFRPQVEHYQGVLLGMAAISVIYPALLAMQTSSPKALLSYSSISHLGFVMLGVFTMSETSATSAILLSVSHGLTSTLLFYLLELITDRKKDVTLNQYSGMARQYPVLFVALFIGVLASVSLPGTFNFVGEFLVLTGAYHVSVLATVFATVGVILGVVYMLRFYQKIGYGPSDALEANNKAHTTDMNGFDFWLVCLLVVLIIYFGFQPALFLGGV